MGVKNKITDTLMLPISTAAIFTSAKSFRSNRVLASPALNKRGLHRKRVEIASYRTAKRRLLLGNLLSEEHRHQFDKYGYVVIKNVLPQEDFAKLSNEVENADLLAHENRSGDTLNRFCALSPKTLKEMPHLQSFLAGPLFRGLIQYAASFRHDPIFKINTVITHPGTGTHDPNTMYHSDTFHSIGKGWFFLRDVDLADGPFSFVPGSHKPTPGRLDWEYQMSLTAPKSSIPLNTIGSPRATASEIASMGYPEAIPFVVPANSLVVADTHGFHARCISTRPSVRMAVYSSLRANPFVPFTSLDVFSLPGLKGRREDAASLLRYAHSKLSGRALEQPPVGKVKPGAVVTTDV